jgi:hypothetical protein
LYDSPTGAIEIRFLKADSRLERSRPYKKSNNQSRTKYI